MGFFCSFDLPLNENGMSDQLEKKQHTESDRSEALSQAQCLASKLLKMLSQKKQPVKQ